MLNCFNSQKLSAIDLFNVASTVDAKASLLPLIAPKKSVKRARGLHGKKGLRNIMRDPFTSSRHLKFISRTERHRIIMSEKWRRPNRESSSNRYSTFIKCGLTGGKEKSAKTNKSMNEIKRKVELLRSQNGKLSEAKRENVFPPLSKAKVFNKSLIKQQAKENCGSKGDTCFNFIRLLRRLKDKSSNERVIVLKEKKNKELSLMDSSDSLSNLLCQKYS
eukprot:TRINITY_DN7456_c0_g2_i2.p1 TRINITY_DN7456_c0_g2~~TRINITY_DN7456_c0_g2_i2.p1  ORF type:complete len:219 (-),score=63.60 TRINITY_DN7456_c0_g2_i2:92-748(-)